MLIRRWNYLSVIRVHMSVETLDWVVLKVLFGVSITRKAFENVPGQYFVKNQFVSCILDNLDV